jgi:O-antigen ligase
MKPPTAQLPVAPPPYPARRLFGALASCTVLGLLGALYLEAPVLAALPFGLMFAWLTLHDFRAIYLFMLACLPLGTEVYFSDSLSTDLPTEPLIIALTGVGLLYVLQNPRRLVGAWLLHPMTVLLAAIVAWMLVCVVFSTYPIVSLKFWVAKIWYLTVFYLMGWLLVRHDQDARQLVVWVVVPLALATLKVVVHHATMDFGFKEINEAVLPFFRNHVSYAAMLALLLPPSFLFLLREKRGSRAWWLWVAAIAVMFFGMATAYTRAAYIALFLAFLAYWTIRFRLMRHALLLGMAVLLSVVVYLMDGRRYLEFVPSQQTVAHTDFGSIVEATSQLEDVSTMERYYRWVAAVRMSGEKPWMGFGPGTFYNNYQDYTLNRFSTYVSANPERSGVHNYFLMTLCDQGLIGLVLILALTLYGLYLGERVWHQSPPHSLRRTLVMSATLTIVVTDAFLLMNDLLETDKVGTLYYLNLAILVALDLKNRNLPSVSKVH